MTPIKKILSSAAASLLLAAGSSHAADVIVVNLDGPGVGFNDPTPAAPVGGNPGTTLGEQRQFVFSVAAQAWGAELESEQPIFVAAFFSPLFCGGTSAVLGSAGPLTVHANFPEAPLQDTWYVGAVADALTGVDQAPTTFDMVARFNGDLGKDPNCLIGQSWYNGFDHNNDPNSEIDLLSVVMHEMGHGLGFLELVSESTGDLFFGLADAYSVNMFDSTLNKSWPEMTSEERLFSQANTGNLLWSGFEVSRQAPNVLGPRPSIIVDDPDELEGSYEAQAATFGKPLRPSGESRDVSIADDGVGVGTDACEPIVNRRQVKSTYALVDRGGCAFTVKALNVQNAGGKGVIVINNVPKGLPGMGGFDDSVKIRAVGITMELGNALKAALADDDDDVEVELSLDRRFQAGTGDNGLVRLYAPDPVRPGSSKSHFDTTASPNLLMEPFINDDLVPTIFLDLTTPLMADIGWVLTNPFTGGGSGSGGGDDDDDDDDDDD